MSQKQNDKYFLMGLGAFIVLLGCMIGFNVLMEYTSTNAACMACHVHPDAEARWKQSVHYNNASGTVTDCAKCHLPPAGDFRHLAVKARFGVTHIFAFLTKKKSNIDWHKMQTLEHARGIVFNESCEACHVNLYPQGISDDGITAHLYYDDNKASADLDCISCHLDAGHFLEGYKHEKMVGKVDTGSGEIYSSAAEVDGFRDFTETVPGTSASISMVAIPGGSFRMGSDSSEPFHRDDESPVREVTVSSFFMSEVEVTWNQYWAFYNETMSEGRTPPSVVYANNSRPDVDAVTGPTPPFGFPDHGWGMGDRPAITMSHYAAETFCQWLSLKTGRTYRLPTEAEWEYAARGGTDSPYFFEGSPKSFTASGFWKKFSKPSTEPIGRYAIYAANSGDRTQEPSSVEPNPFGLKNMLGNVMEYCSDWYSADAYASGETVDPKGPSEGTEHVVRGGNYGDDASQLRCAARSHTENDAWLKTDPQNPKSIWWYSDIVGIGFRVVCEVPEGIDVN